LSLTEREEPTDASRRDPRLSGPTDQSNRVNPRQPSSGPSSSNADDDSEYFTVVEDGIGGRCEVSYLVLEIPDSPESIYPIYDTDVQPGSNGIPPRNIRKPRSSDDSNVLNVTKTFDYRHCEFRPFFFRGLHFSSACPGCDSDDESFFDFLESAAHTRYNITGTKEHYIIDSAITEAVYKFTPRSHYAGSMVAYANVTVTLMESGPVKGPINFPEQNSVQIDGLHMIDPKFARREGDKVYYETPEANRPILQRHEYWPNVQGKPQKIRALFEKLVQGMDQKDNIESSTAVLVEYIIRYLKYSFADELEQIHTAIKSVSSSGVQAEEIEHLFADLLVATGTNCTFTYLKKLLVEKKLQGPVVLDVLSLLPFKIRIDSVSPDMIEEWIELCEDPAMQSDSFVKRSCWLSFGTLIHKACAHDSYDARTAWNASASSNSQGNQQKPSRPWDNNNDDDEVNLRCPAELRQRVVQKVIEMMNSAGSGKGDSGADEEKILAIKVIGNMGLNETVDELATIIEDESAPVYIRTQAIYALKHVAAEYPDLVLDTVLPLYRQTKNPTQIRIAAFIVILAAQPDLPLLEDVAQSLNREPDLDVASYVYSSMSSLANSTDPCLKNLTRDLILALEFATPVNADFRHSKSVHKGAYVDHMKRGIFWETSHVMDRDAPVPKAANFRLHANIMEKSLELIEMGFETEGFGDAMRKYVKNFTAESLDEVLKGQASRRPRQAGSQPDAPEINQIEQMLNLKSSPPKEVRGTAYLKFFGQQTRFVVINPQTVSRFLVDLISQSKSVVPQLTGEGLALDQRRATMLLDAKLEFPTVLGVPIGNSIRIPIVASMKGKVKINMEPKPAEGFGLFKQTPNKLVMENTVQTTIAAEVHTKMNVYLAFIKIGTGVRTSITVNAPVNGKLEFSLKDKMTKVIMNLPESPVKLVKLQSFPVTFVTRLSAKSGQTFSQKSIPSGQLAARVHHAASEGSSESEETPAQQSQRGMPTQNVPSDRLVYLNISTIPSDLLTKTGHLSLSKWAGLPIPTIEIWEIATSVFVKARKVHLQVGHESTAARIDLKSEMEYPDSRIPTHLLPVLGAKCQMEIKLTPKTGSRKVIVTVYERSEFSTKPQAELLNKLKDKVADLTIKELSTPSTVKDVDKSAKVGHSLQILVNAEGNDAPDAWTTRGLLAILYTMDGRYTKVIAGLNSKVPALPKKLCLTGDLQGPERTGMWFLTPQQPMNNKSIQGNLEMSWGDDCGSDKYVKLRMRMQKTNEQLEIESNDLYDENGIPVPAEVASEVREGEGLFQSLYKQCEEDRKVGAFFSQECVEFVIRYTDLNRLKFDVEFKDVSRPIRGILHKLERLAKGAYYWNTEVQDVDIKNPENRINAVVELSADRSHLDIKYQTPKANVSMINLDLPAEIMPPSAFFPWTYSRLFGLSMPISCTLSGPKISTFDDVSDEMPLSQCWHLLTMDESDEDLFAVLVASAAKNSITKKIAVIFQGHRIEVIPTGNAAQSSPQSPPSMKNFVVKYNGQELKDALTPEKRTTIPPNLPEDKQELADIMLVKPEHTGNKEPVLAIISRVTGLTVVFDGASVTVIPSPFWKNSLVGLCGSYNGQPWDDKLLPNKTLVEEPEELSRAFLLPTPGCDQEIPVPPTQPMRPKSRNV
jgi:hypothetical protein